MKENAIYCAKCDKEMREVLLPKYEFEEVYLYIMFMLIDVTIVVKYFLSRNKLKKWKLEQMN